MTVKKKQPPGMKLRRYAVMAFSLDEMMGFASLYPSYEATRSHYFASANAPKIRAQERMPL
jgi:hypothetical protein